MDPQQRELITSVAAKVLANTSEGQALNLTELLQSQLGQRSTQSAAIKPQGKKHQCRWCIDTFDKKSNKDRHEGRKHKAELDAAAADSVRQELHKATASRKRLLSEVVQDASDQEVDQGEGLATGANVDPSVDSDIDHSGEQESKHQAKRSRTTQSDVEDASSSSTSSHAMDTDELMQDAIEADHVVEPGEATSDDLLKQQFDALQKENADKEVLQSGVLFDDATMKKMDAADEHIAACCVPFLSWLCAPAVTEAERLVKARRVDPKQLAPVKKNLAFIIRLLLGTQAVLEPTLLKLDLFTQEKVCQQLNTFLEERQVGASRIYALFLLIKKVLVYLASSESVRRRQYIAPNTWNSWTCVDTICSDSNTHRKQISRNRKLLGAEQCRKLTPAPARSVPTAEDLKMPAMYGAKKKSHPTTASAVAAASSSSSSAAAAATASVSLQLRSEPSELKPSELIRINRGCLEYFKQQSMTSNQARSLRDNTRYTSYLLTATLTLALAPRQEVLRQLQIGSSFVKKEDGRYWVLMLSHMNKNGRATSFPIAQELTPAFDQYLDTIRPQLMANKVHNYVFCKQSGDAVGAEFNFGDWVHSVSKEIIGRPVNCHAFRSALVTLFHKNGASQSQMNALAEAMAHDANTQRDYYFKGDAQQQALEVHERMRLAYGLEPGPSAAGYPASPAAQIRCDDHQLPTHAFTQHQSQDDRTDTQSALDAVQDPYVPSQKDISLHANTATVLPDDDQTLSPTASLLYLKSVTAAAALASSSTY